MWNGYENSIQNCHTIGTIAEFTKNSNFQMENSEYAANMLFRNRNGMKFIYRLLHKVHWKSFRIPFHFWNRARVVCKPIGKLNEKDLNMNIIRNKKSPKQWWLTQRTFTENEHTHTSTKYDGSKPKPSNNKCTIEWLYHCERPTTSAYFYIICVLHRIEIFIHIYSFRIMQSYTHIAHRTYT